MSCRLAPRSEREGSEFLQVPDPVYRGERTEFFLCLRAYIQKVNHIRRLAPRLEREDSEFLQVPGPIGKLGILTCAMFYVPPTWFQDLQVHPSPPTTLMTSLSRKCPGDLEKFPAMYRGGNFRIREYTPHPLMASHSEDVVNMKEIIMKEYVENLKEHEYI